MPLPAARHGRVWMVVCICVLLTLCSWNRHGLKTLDLKCSRVFIPPSTAAVSSPALINSSVSRIRLDTLLEKCFICQTAGSLSWVRNLRCNMKLKHGRLSCPKCVHALWRLFFLHNSSHAITDVWSRGGSFFIPQGPVCHSRERD